MEHTNFTPMIITAVLALLAFFYMLFKKLKKETVSTRLLVDLTREERYAEYPVSNAKVDAVRTGRWKITYMDGTQATKLGLLTNMLGDNVSTFSPASKYREIL